MKKVSSGIITYQGKLLMMHRAALPAEIDNPDKWGLIGGHHEEGETPEEAMIREAKEEANIDVTNVNLVLHSHFFTDKREEKDYYFFHIPLNDTQADQVRLMDEGQAVEFKSWDEMQELDLTSTINQLLADEKNKKKLQNLLNN